MRSLASALLVSFLESGKSSRWVLKKNLVLLILLPPLAISQTGTWTPTTAPEFSKRTFNTIAVSNVNGRELSLSHPFVRQGPDTLDDSVPQFVDYDDAGNYAAAWVSGGRVYVQKFSPTKQPLTGPILVDDHAGVIQQATPGIALLNSGKFVVGWRSRQSIQDYDLRYIQFFDSDGSRIRGNLRVFQDLNLNASVPQPIADRTNERFIIISSERVSTEPGFELFALIYSADGVKLRDLIDLVPQSITLSEFNPRGMIKDGKLTVVWQGDNDNVLPSDTYVAQFDSNCVLLAAPVRVAEDCMLPTIASDDKGNFCVTWFWSGFRSSGPPDEIHAQILDPLLGKIGSVIDVAIVPPNELPGGGLMGGITLNPHVEFLDDTFRIAWRARQYHADPLSWVSYWKLEGATTHPRFRIASVGGNAGDTILVPVYAMGVTGISGFKALFTFDADRLTLLEARTTALTSEFVLSRKNIGNSLAELTLEGSNSLTLDSGAVMTLEFLAGRKASGNVPVRFQTIELFGGSVQAAEGVSFEDGVVVLGVTSIQSPDPTIPTDFVLYQNFPNPFNPSTTIQYALPFQADVEVTIFDVLGRGVEKRQFVMQPAGLYNIELNLGTLASGMYFYRVRAGDFVRTKKMVISR